MRIPIENGAPAAGDAARKGRLVVKRLQKITFAEMRAGGVRGLLICCSDYKCSHWTAISGDGWPDDVRLSDLEPKFTCQACGRPTSDQIGGQLRPMPDKGWSREFDDPRGFLKKTQKTAPSADADLMRSIG